MKVWAVMCEGGYDNNDYVLDLYATKELADEFIECQPKYMRNDYYTEAFDVKEK